MMDEFMNNTPGTDEGKDAPATDGQVAEPVSAAEVPSEEPATASEEPAVVPASETVPPRPVYQPPVQQGGYAYSPYGVDAPDNAAQPPRTQPYVYNPNGVPYAQYQPPVNSGGRKSNKKGRNIFLIILAVVVAVSAVAIPLSLRGKNNPESPELPGIADGETPTVNENAPSLDINDTPEQGLMGSGVLTPEQVYEKIAASNVAVIVYRNNSVYTEGTGIIMKEDDAKQYTYILTCAHVISDSGTEIVIQFEDGTRHDAEMVGYDLRTDIGVLRIKATGFKAAEFGNSDSLKVGSTVYAIGNPGGSALFGTFTDGKVSAIGRSITSSIGYDMVCIQHNAAISPGNSGGALVNEYGQVIGINSSKIAATEFEGISFSIPITQAKDIINKIIAYGYVPGRAKLGISYVANDSSSISGIYGMAVQMMDLPSGSLVIYSIDADSALAGTDAQPGDMITAVNGKKLDTADVLLETIEDSSVGDELELSIFRIESVGGKYSTNEFTVKVKLIEEKNTGYVEETTTHGVYGNDGYDFGFDFGF